MRILLLGEHSGIHAELKQGLTALGHEVLLVSNGASWRKIGADINLMGGGKGIVGKVGRLARPFQLIPKFGEFDVVQLVHTDVFRNFLGTNRIVIREALKRSAKVFLSVSGCDPAFYQFNNAGSGSAALCESCKLRDLKRSTCRYQTEDQAHWNDEIIANVDGVIPWAYEYGQAFREFQNVPNLMETMPFPISVENIPYFPNRSGAKVVFFHGLNREGFKGTDLITAAMENLRKRYPNDVDVIVDGRMPLKQYQDLLRRVNVVIDQLYSLSYGMNALYSMAHGKVVLAGNDRGVMESIGLGDCPIVSITPDIRAIEAAMKRVLETKDRMEDIGAASRRFVSEHHASQTVAARFVDLWRSAGA